GPRARGRRHRARLDHGRDRSGRSGGCTRPHPVTPARAPLRDRRADGRTHTLACGQEPGMIRYTLVCERKHDFESWFHNSAAFGKQAKRGLVTCPVCGSSKVEKAIMAPSPARKDKSTSTIVAEPPAAAPPEAPQPAPEKTPVAIVSPQEREFRAKLK